MTPTERHAVREALRTANFTRSPGLRDRLRHSLATPPEWGCIAMLALSVAFWALLIWGLV